MKYRNPSISEALCEFTFAESSPWDATLFGRLYEGLENDFPTRESFVAHVVDVSKNRDGRLQQDFRQRPRMKFGARDKRCFFQVGENMAAANVLHPYPGWHNFLPLISRVLKKYFSSCRPLGVTKTILKYINVFELPSDRFSLSHWINTESNACLPRWLGEPAELVLSSSHKKRADRFETVTLQAQTGERGSSIILDIEVGTESPDASEADTTAGLEKLHERVTELFELSITARLRDRLVVAENK